MNLFLKQLFVVGVEVENLGNIPTLLKQILFRQDIAKKLGQLKSLQLQSDEQGGGRLSFVNSTIQAEFFICRDGDLGVEGGNSREGEGLHCEGEGAQLAV